MNQLDFKSYLNSLLENKWATALLIVFAVLVSRIIFLEHYFSDVDTVGYALGSVSYSLEQTRPHMPGYFLHVMAIRVFNLVTLSPHKSMIILSLIYSSAGSVLIWMLLKKFFSNKASMLGALFIAVNPLIWYYSCTTDIYVFDLFFSAAFVLMGVSKKGIYFLPAFTAFGMGIRPSSGILLFPLYIYFWYSLKKEYGIDVRGFSLSHIAALLVFAFWFYPMALSVGSVARYFNLFKSNSPLPSISLIQNIFQFSSYLFWFSIPMLLVIIYLFITRKIVLAYKTVAGFFRLNKFFLIWSLIPLLFFMAIHYNRGYLNLIALPLLMPVVLLYDKNILSKSIFISAFLISGALFLFIPANAERANEWFNREQRNGSIINTWINRTFSSYSMTASRIKSQDETIRGMMTLIDKVKRDGLLKSGTVFIDPSLYSYARTLEYSFPDVGFVTFDFNNPDSYIEYAGGTIQRLPGFKERLKGAWLLSAKSSFDSYLSGIGIKGTIGEGGLEIVPIAPENADNLSYIYIRYFLRR